MAYDNMKITARLQDWLQGMEYFALPEWDDLPQLELYMDQVIILLKQYLAPLHRGEEDKAITASIINNYVRMKIMPAPVKKKYSRIHLACLIMICTLKRSLSISCIQRILPADHSEESVRLLYDDFVRQYRTVQKTFMQQAQSGDHQLFSDDVAGFLTSCAIISNLSTGLSEFLLQEENTEHTEKKKKTSAE
ncbi:MAG: DUF1836 domain-containing protein [Oscillospiraceae bacterium]|nr:DUF1836 domain-containing protein [Oscillospiraceae bacterium]